MHQNNPHDDAAQPAWPFRPKPRRCAGCDGPMHPLPLRETSCASCQSDDVTRLAARGIAQLETMLALHAALDED